MSISRIIRYQHRMSELNIWVTCRLFWIYGRKKVLTLNLLNFLNWIIRFPFLELSIINLKFVSQQYTSWSDCTDVQAGVALYLWQKLITYGFSRIRVNIIVCLVYSEFISVHLYRKLLAYRHTLKSIPGTNQYRAINVKFLTQRNNSLLLTQGLNPCG